MGKKVIAVLLMVSMLMCGCGGDISGISQEEYDKVIAERDELQEKYDELWDKYSNYYAENEVENIKQEIQENVDSKDENIKSEEPLQDFTEESFFTYSGNGDDIVSGAATESTSYAHIIHEGDGHFSVKGHYGDSCDLLVNTTDPYNGTTLIYPGKEYTFEVSAKGEWSIELYKLGTSSVDSFSGNGDFITPIFVKTSDVYEINTNGGGHFSVKGWNDSNYDLLVNTTDENYSGKVMFNSEKEYAFFEISASREWEIKPAE